MGLQQPPRLRRVGLFAVAAAGVLALPACSATTKDEWKRAAMPEGAADHSASVIHFWQWSWVTAMIIGVLVWGLIIFAVFKYRRRHDDEVPVQTRYNLPIELLYTVAPVIIVLVYFKFIIDTQQDVLSGPDEQGKPDHVVTVVGQQWAWTFNYIKDPALDGQTTVFKAGNPQDIPTLHLPVNETVKFQLRSPDVIHSFWVPAFTYKLDVFPGSNKNDFTMTPVREGTFEGRCAELCGTYHSRMLFNVVVESKAKYAAYLKSLEDEGNTGLAIGGREASTGTVEGQQSESGANE